MNTTSRLLNNTYLSDGTTVDITSPAISPIGNRAILAINVIAASGLAATSVAKLQGSYDGITWLDVTDGTASLQNVGYRDSAKVVVDHAFLRIYASVAPNNGSADCLFDASIDQYQE